MSPTFMICVCDKVHDFVVDFAANFPVLCRGLNSISAIQMEQVCRRLLMDFVTNILTCRDALCP